MSQQQPDPEERLSAAFDGESTDSGGLSDERRYELEHSWTMVRSELQALPTEPADLVASVRQQLVESRQPVVQRAPAKPHGWVSSLTVVAAVAAVVLLVILPRPDSTDLSDQHRRSVAVLRKHVDRLIPDLANCNVVVIHVAAEDSMEASVSEMLGAAKARGAAVTPMHSQVDDGAEYSAGFLLTSGSEAQAILETVSGDSEQLDWNPADIGGRSPAEIKEMFLASMRVPSESDKVFGAMYVVNEDSLVVSLEQLPDTETERVSALAMSDQDEAESDVLREEEVVPASAPVMLARSAEDKRTPSSPLIVIFRRQVAAETMKPVPGQGESRPRAAMPLPV